MFRSAPKRQRTDDKKWGQFQVTPAPLIVLMGYSAALGVGLVLVIGMAVSSCAVTSSPSVSASWRYRMTVEVETPEGIKRGSAVREVDTNTYLWPAHHDDYPNVKGEAVVVNLGKRGVLFASMRNAQSGTDYFFHVVFDAFPPPSSVAPRSIEGERYYGNLVAGPVPLMQQNFPMFVHFKDLKNPKTVEPVIEVGGKRDKSEGYAVKSDHTEEIFGKGVHIKSVTIEMTKEPVTKVIRQWLPWLSEYHEKMFDGQRYNTSQTNYPFANSMSAGSFEAGEIK